MCATVCLSFRVFLQLNFARPHARTRQCYGGPAVKDTAANFHRFIFFCQLVLLGRRGSCLFCAHVAHWSRMLKTIRHLRDERKVLSPTSLTLALQRRLKVTRSTDHITEPPRYKLCTPPALA